MPGLPVDDVILQVQHEVIEGFGAWVGPIRTVGTGPVNRAATRRQPAISTAFIHLHQPFSTKHRMGDSNSNFTLKIAVWNPWFSTCPRLRTTCAESGASEKRRANRERHGRHGPERVRSFTGKWRRTARLRTCLRQAENVERRQLAEGEKLKSNILSQDFEGLRSITLPGLFAGPASDGGSRSVGRHVIKRRE